MVELNLSHTAVNKSTNEINVHLEKDPHVQPYLHQAILKLDAKEALNLIDQLKTAVKSLTEKD